MAKGRFSSLLDNSNNNEEKVDNSKKEETAEVAVKSKNVDLNNIAYSIVFNNETNTWGVATIKFNFTENAVADVVEFQNSGSKSDAVYDFKIKASHLMG